jgi:hypothetical protein
MEALQGENERLSWRNNQLRDELNKAGRTMRKYWGAVAKNLTLHPKDTLAVSVYIDGLNGYMGIEGLDRLELTWVGIYSPDLAEGEVETAKVVHYFGPGLGQAELPLGVKRIALTAKQDPVVIVNPISSNETLVRESTNSVSFFFENYNYLGYAWPGNWLTIKFFYDGPVRLTISELELYIVGWTQLKAGELKDFEPGWIGHNVQVEVRHWREMT